jgi:hypothetical protein
VDLVDVDRASPIVARQALRTGQLLLDRNPRHRWQLEASMVVRCEDLMIVRREAEQTLIERMRGGRS